MSTNKFAAIDFETADEKSDSACSLSIVIVQNYKIIKQVNFLIQPPRDRFIFTYIHGIKWSDVKEMPTFSNLWPSISQHFSDIDFIAAHNASFDRNVLYSCCQKAYITPPSTPFVCTVDLSRKIWGIYPTKLPDVCKKLGISLNHHNAASDAMACAQIVIAAYNKNNLHAFLQNKY